MLSWLLLFCLATTTAQAQIWGLTGSLTYARYWHTATLLPNGNVLVAGGDGGNSAINTAEVYSATTGVWIVTSSLTYARGFQTATLLPNGNVLVAGGCDLETNGVCDNYLNSAEVYNITGFWTVTGSLTYTRAGHTATLLPDGNVLVGAGFNGELLNSAELYNNATGVWTLTGNLTYARDWHTATLLTNGNVLVAGGFTGSAFLNSAELYNATTGVWTVTGSLTYVRGYHTATLLPNGNVLVAGGYNYAFPKSAELYNAITGVWTVTGDLTDARSSHTAALLPNGNVLIAGGCDVSNCGDQINSAELYNATTGVWTVAGSLMYARTYHASALLTNGNVFVIAGYDNGGNVLNSAEFYITTNVTVLPDCCNVSQGVYSETSISLNLQVDCANCDDTFTSFGNFSQVTFYNADFVSTISLSCMNCSGLVDFGSFPSQSPLLQISLNCTNCPSLQSLGYFSSASATYSNLSLTCDNCASLTLFGSFLSLTSIASTISIACSSCASLASLGNFPLLESNAPVSISCSTCPSIQSLGSFSSLTKTTSSLDLSCTNCSSLASFGSFPSLSINSPVSLLCINCPAIANVSFPSLPNNQLATSITFTCYNCPSSSFTLDMPIVFVFSGVVPRSFSSNEPSASLSFFNAILAAPLSFNGLVRLQSLSFINILAGLNVDFLVNLDRVEGSIIIQNTTFINIDGITASLAFAGSTTVTNNPVLCNIDVNKLETVTTNPPIIINNGFNTICSILEPTTPPRPYLVGLTSSSVELNLTLPTQPSVSTTYSLIVDGVPLLTFPSWNPVALPYSINSLSPGTTYTFVLIATLGAIGVSSPSLMVTTNGGIASNCPPGYYKQNGTCTACGMAQFPSLDLLSCISCPSGTYSTISALSSSISCQLCSSSFYSSSSQSLQCSPCPSSNYCPFGATIPISSFIYASPANETNTSSTSSNGLALAFIYLIVFFGLAFVSGVAVVIFPKRIRSVFLKFAVVIRTPRFLFRVNPSNWRILELPSVIRGLIGFWVLLGLILVTIYQINNFIVNQFGSSSYIQPGTKFSSGQPILSATTIINVTVVLFASPITCDPSLFATSSTLNGVVSCTSNATTTTFTLTTPLSSLPSSVANLQLTITAANGNLAYAPALQYSFTSLRYNNLNYSVTETIVGGSNTVVTGTSTINIAAVATESLDVNGLTLNTGYDFSYISTSASTSNSPSSSLVLSFQLSVPQYFLQVRQVVAITPLVFLSGLLAIGGGVIAVGTLIAFVISYAAHHWLKTGAGRQDGSAIELVKSSKQDPQWL